MGTHIYEQVGLVGARALKGLFVVRPTTDTRETLYDEEMVMQIHDSYGLERLPQSSIEADSGDTALEVDAAGEEPHSYANESSE